MTPAPSISGTDATRCLRELIGAWEGTGKGGFPTIDPFEYRETIVVSEAGGPAQLRYVVKTWRLEKGREVPSHQEAGFINAAPDGRVEVLNAQGADRVEVLHGEIHRAEGSWVLSLVSTLHGHDARMRSASREITVVDGDEIHYTMHMRTDRVGSSETHLEAVLRRADPEK